MLIRYRKQQLTFNAIGFCRVRINKRLSKGYIWRVSEGGKRVLEAKERDMATERIREGEA